MNDVVSIDEKKTLFHWKEKGEEGQIWKTSPRTWKTNKLLREE